MLLNDFLHQQQTIIQFLCNVKVNQQLFVRNKFDVELLGECSTNLQQGFDVGGVKQKLQVWGKGGCELVGNGAEVGVGGG